VRNKDKINSYNKLAHYHQRLFPMTLFPESNHLKSSNTSQKVFIACLFRYNILFSLHACGHCDSQGFIMTWFLCNAWQTSKSCTGRLPTWYILYITLPLCRYTSMLSKSKKNRRTTEKKPPCIRKE